MQLTAKMLSRFPQRIRHKGESYFSSGHVDAVVVAEDHVFADVDGTDDTHLVIIDLGKLGKKSGGMSCSCPWFAKGHNCKHLWATLLYLDHHEPQAGGGSNRFRGDTSAYTSRVAQPPSDAWRSVFRAVSTRRYEVDSYAIRAHDDDRLPVRLHYVIDVSRLSRRPGNRRLLLSLVAQEHLYRDVWTDPEPLMMNPSRFGILESPADEQIVARLMGAERPRENQPPHPRHQIHHPTGIEFYVSSAWDDELFAALAATGRVGWTLSLEQLDDFTPVEIDVDEPYEVTVEFEEPQHSAASRLSVSLRNSARTYPSGSVLYVSDDGLALLPDRLVRIANSPTIEFLRSVQEMATDILVQPEDRDAFLEELLQLQDLPAIRFPDSWGVTQSSVAPQGQLSIGPPHPDRLGFSADLWFRYDDCEVHATDTHPALFDRNSRSWIPRDLDAERRLCDELDSLPIENASYYNASGHYNLRIAPDDFETLVGGLAERGWRVLWDGKRLRPPGNFNIQVTSGQDWFDVYATIEFDGEVVELPEILVALKEGARFVTLADGSRGKLPAELIARYARLADLGEVHEDAVRFRPSQAMLLDAMLDAQEHVITDPGFRKFREKLKSFDGIKPRNGPRGFHGQLREYQQAGVGWLHFLQEFKFGGCLADDMGLGKTIQILALLETRRTRRLGGEQAEVLAPATAACLPGSDAEADAPERAGQPLLDLVAEFRRKPSIVVVPKSLVFNWLEEAARFTPRLRLHNHTGIDRLERAAQGDAFDVLVTTYGTLRRDIAYLSRIRFDYAILDESQAIKNANAQAAKASRLLTADHRLAMTGTPIENHLGELWSLFEFLNPGLLGRSKSFTALTNRKVRDDSHQHALDALARGLKPFILRRTKDQVLDDLPAKTEQTLHCQMSPAQRKQYDELRDYYRLKLGSKIEERGIERSKIHVLEALLRLRQVACDPRLVDPQARPGGKLKLLQEQLVEVVDEGHKILVFSQFTKLLGLVKAELDSAGIAYEYLDGRTSNRGEKVRRFQEDDNIRLFLISLKAGGHGLNLTAADYVYLLDPWWNPAVEAQAIDRAHRMGQQRPVNAYRIICENTVEEKILQLQQTKRDLAERIIQADDSLIQRLSAEDLELLLS